jgi:uncharacterized protein YbaA (DUF1428 family)
MDTSPLLANRWSDRFAFDIALRLEGSGDDLTDILQRHGVSASDLLEINSDPLFLKRVAAYRDDIRDKGVTFRMKARAQAEELLTTSWVLIHSPDVSAAVKADLIKSTVKWAGLEPKGEDSSGGPAGGVRITINLGNEQLGTARLIDATPVENAQDGESD